MLILQTDKINSAISDDNSIFDEFSFAYDIYFE